MKEVVPSGQHIFNETKLSKLAMQWKDLIGQLPPCKNRSRCDKGESFLCGNSRNKCERINREAMILLEEIVVGSTQMFQRLAQHENFHHTVDLGILVSAAQSKMVKWLEKWDPKKGKLFSWMSKCSKNSFKSEVVKVNQFRNRFHVTGDNLEKFFGAADTEVDKHEGANRVHDKITEISCRWGDPQEIGCIRYLIDCIIEEGHDKSAAIDGAAYAWGMPRDHVKFFYQWAVVSLREVFYDQVHVPFTRQDLFRHEHSYSHLVDLLNVITWDQMKLLIATRGGMRFKIPTMPQMAKLHQDYLIMCDIQKSDLDPDSVNEVAQKHKKSLRSAQEIYEEMCNKINPNRSGEHQVYDP